MEEKLKQAIQILTYITQDDVIIFEYIIDGWRFINFDQYTISFGDYGNRRRLCSISKEKNPELGFSSLEKCLDFIINYNETK